MSKVYLASDWIPSASLIYSHARNRDLNPETHSHDFFEIVYLLEGSVLHRYNGFMKEMRPGEVVFLRPGDTHMLFRRTAELNLYSISAVVQEITPLLTAYGMEKDIRAAETPLSFSLAQQKSAVASLFESLPQLDMYEQREQLFIILGMTIHAFLFFRRRGRQMWLENVLQKMNCTENLAEGVSALQRLCSLSHAQLCRVIKKQTGKTPQQYVRELRLLRAYDLIQSTDMPFEDIANAVGYYSLSHFSATFKERFGMTPAVLRKQNMTIL